ncbi:MAG: DNA-protecting protein DprA [Planctomycetes bacterium]|nr:DNA-protecting protein DprA [Planctomycetota bacterium]
MTSLPEETRDLLALQLIPGLGPLRIAALLERFGSPGAVLAASAEQLAGVSGFGTKLSADIVQGRREVDVEEELRLLEKHGVRLVARGTPEYPAALAEIYDPPHLLYVRGTLEERDARAVAVVGSRQCSDYGRRVTMRLAGDLARAGWTVVSGLARGTDGLAHKGALQAGGRTLAVLAGGLSSIYPPEHRGLADEVEKAGALLTESCMKQDPLASLFPARNRIISGLCRAVVLVEAAEKSGALITATHAAEQGRNVLAVPGPVDAPPSSGTNALIRQGAVLCRGIDDILEELQGVSALATAAKASAAAAQAAPAPAGPPPWLDETQRRVWDFLAGGPRHLDEMVQQLGITVAQLAGMLLTMEMKKAVRRLPGNRYERA